MYLVDNGSDIPLCRYAILIIKKGTGEKYYWGMDDIRMDNIGMREYESTLSPEGLAFIKKICRDLQNEEFHYKGKRPPKTKVIKLLESDLYDIIEDAIIQVLY